MAIETFEYPDYPCKKCGWVRHWEVRRCINQGGHETYLFVCSACGQRTQHFISKAEVEAAGLEPEDIEPSRPRHKCEVCGTDGAEIHHWAPWFLFGDEANRWPQSFLCPACHKRWHDIVTPNANGTLSGRTHR